MSMDASSIAAETGSGGRLEVMPTAGALGAEIRCGDLRKIDEQLAAAIRRAWLDHLVVFFRGQDFTDADLVAFGGRFGEFQYSNPLGSPLANEGRVKQGGRIDGFPEITVVSNIVENGVAAGGLGDGEVIWHTDMSSRKVPPHQTILYALEVPPAGGQTGFANMYLAWDTLPDALKQRVEGLSLKHDSLIDAAGYPRKFNPHGDGATYEGFDKLVTADIRSLPGAVHPLVRTHPETGRDCLYLGRRSNAYLVDLELDESEALLDELWAHATDPRFAWSHAWRRGDVVMWDNRCVMHRREPFDPGARRRMHRIVIKGSEPVRRHDPRSHFAREAGERRPRE